VKFTTLALQNFLTIGEATLGLADRGLVCIQGINKDDTSAESNGAGKSSLADGLCWALYGVTARGVSGDAVVNRSASKDCLVRVTIEDGDVTYAITRHRKHRTGKNSLALQSWLTAVPGSVATSTKGTDKLTQIEVERILGCSYEVFRAAIYAGQEQMPDLPALTDKSLKVLIEQAAGITLLESAYELAKIDCASAKGDVERAKTLVDRLWVNINGTAEQEKHARAERVEFEIRREAWIEAQKVMAREKHKVLEHLAGEIDAGDRSKVERQLTACRKKLDAVAGELTEERRLADELTKADRTMTIAHSQATAVKGDVERLKTQREKIGERVGKPCGECGKPYCADDLHDASKIATDSLRVSVARFKAAKEAFENAREARQSVADALEAHRASMTDVSKFNALSDALNASLRKITDLENQHRMVKAEIDGLIERIEARKTEPNPHDAAIKRCMTVLEKLNKDQEEAVAQLADAQSRLDLAEAAVKVFGPAGARAHILDSVTPFLNTQTARYLGTLSDGRIEAVWTTLARTAKGELKEKFTIEVTKDRAGDTFAALSGGEKRKVRLACALALQDLVASRATKPIELFIGDEVDDALDDAGLERLMSVLEEKARERGTVMVISHRSLRDWIRNIVTIVNEGGRSVIEEEAA
jgi:DNA repair exonuclease SbcCD ATPase subunit